MANPVSDNTTMQTSLYQQMVDAVDQHIAPEEIATLSEVKDYLEI